MEFADKNGIYWEKMTPFPSPKNSKCFFFLNISCLIIRSNYVANSFQLRSFDTSPSATYDILPTTFWSCHLELRPYLYLKNWKEKNWKKNNEKKKEEKKCITEKNKKKEEKRNVHY